MSSAKEASCLVRKSTAGSIDMHSCLRTGQPWYWSRTSRGWGVTAKTVPLTQAFLTWSGFLVNRCLLKLSIQTTAILPLSVSCSLSFARSTRFSIGSRRARTRPVPARTLRCRLVVDSMPLSSITTRWSHNSRSALYTIHSVWENFFSQLLPATTRRSRISSSMVLRFAAFLLRPRAMVTYVRAGPSSSASSSSSSTLVYLEL